jgi:hypothetical protein
MDSIGYSREQYIRTCLLVRNNARLGIVDVWVRVQVVVIVIEFVLVLILLFIDFIMVIELILVLIPILLALALAMVIEFIIIIVITLIRRAVPRRFVIFIEAGDFPLFVVEWDNSSSLPIESNWVSHQIIARRTFHVIQSPRAPQLHVHTQYTDVN